MYPTLTEYITSEENINKMVTDLHLSKIPLGVLKSMQSGIYYFICRFFTISQRLCYKNVKVFLSRFGKFESSKF